MRARANTKKCVVFCVHFFCVAVLLYSLGALGLKYAVSESGAIEISLQREPSWNVLAGNSKNWSWDVWVLAFGSYGLIITGFLYLSMVSGIDFASSFIILSMTFSFCIVIRVYFAFVVLNFGAKLTMLCGLLG